MKDEREQRVTSDELRKDPAGVVKKAVTDGPVMITSEQGQPRIRISVPRGPLPTFLD
jgi:prevent-host-death family protein